MSPHHQPSTLAALGRTWVEAWNTRDLERVLTLYDEAAVMTSDRIPAMGFDASGTVRGTCLRSLGLSCASQSKEGTSAAI